MATHSSVLAWRIPWSEERAWWATAHKIAESQTRLSSGPKAALGPFLDPADDCSFRCAALVCDTALACLSALLTPPPASLAL